MTDNTAALIASADEIDNRMGPIAGRSSDRIARELRQAATEIDQLRTEREAVARVIFGDGWKCCANLGPYVQGVATELAEARAGERSAISALTLAIGHIEHMAAWITKQSVGYSFESLGEDMPGIRAAAGQT